MFSEILKIIPRLDGGDLNKLEKSLGSRFTKIAKKFGKGLGASLMGGGIAGLALGFIDKILNPLKDVQDAIDRTLNSGGDVVANAEQFGTTPGQLFKLSKLAEAKGVDTDNLYTLLSKFQVAVAEATQDPTKQTSVRQFVGQKDTAESFFAFLQGMQKLTKEQQLVVQSEVFGEKQIMKIAEFFNSDMPKLVEQLGAKSSNTYTNSLMKIDTYADRADLLKAKRELDDMLVKGNTIQMSMISMRDAQLRKELEKENYQIGSYNSLMKMDRDMTAILDLVQKGYTELLKVVQRAGTISDVLNAFKGSKLLRGIFGKGD